ncbi:MAG: hypothetical protein WCS65_12420 [Verrucomicrobiae bacterium]
MNPRYTSRVAVTRPANDTAYAAGDVLGAASASVIEFTNLAPVGGGPVLITHGALLAEVAAIPSGLGIVRLHLYSAAPTAIADNDAFDLPAGDRAKYLGSISLSLNATCDLGATVFVEDDYLRKQIIASSSSIFGIAQTLAAYTPTSEAVLNWELHTIES